MLQTLTVPTNSRSEFLDLTSQVQEVVRLSGVSEGVCHVFSWHT